MIFEVITSDGNIMLLFIFLRGLTLNIEIYIKYLEEVVLLWFKRVAAGELYV